MDAYIGKNIYRNNNEKVLVPYSTDWSHYNTSLNIIQNEMNDKSKEDCVDLIKKLFNSTVRTAVCGGNFLNNSAKTVIEWKEEVSGDNLECLRNLISMNNIIENSNLTKWQKDILSALKSKTKIINIFIFKTYEQYFLWVLAKEPTTEDIFEYSQEYVNVITNFSGINCDFMVFSEDEIEFYNIPNDAMKF